jgi:hypothetical protein
MTNTNQPTRLTGALVSGVLYLDEQGRVQDVHWCMTADGDDAPADVQPVIRTGEFDNATQTLPEMLAELADRFARAAAAEAAKAVRRNKKAVPAPAVSQAASSEAAPEEKPENTETETRLAHNAEEPAQPETTSGAEQPGAEPACKPASAKPAVSIPSLFDGLDLS